MTDPNEKDGIITLYICFQERTQGWMNLHRQHFTQFITIITAVLAISLGASYQFMNEGWLPLIVALGPLLNIVLSCTAIDVCDRFYKRFLESMTIANKLYFEIDKKYIS